jgi:hypothetical protein
MGRIRLLCLGHGDDRVDQSEATERSGKVAEVPPALRVNLLGIETKWARQRQQLLAELSSPIHLADL